MFTQLVLGVNISLILILQLHLYFTIMQIIANTNIIKYFLNQLSLVEIYIYKTRPDESSPCCAFLHQRMVFRQVRVGIIR